MVDWLDILTSLGLPLWCLPRWRFSDRAACHGATAASMYRSFAMIWGLIHVTFARLGVGEV
jgi:hypothetical protein